MPGLADGTWRSPAQHSGKGAAPPPHLPLPRVAPQHSDVVAKDAHAAQVVRGLKRGEKALGILPGTPKPKVCVRGEATSGRAWPRCGFCKVIASHTPLSAGFLVCACLTRDDLPLRLPLRVDDQREPLAAERVVNAAQVWERVGSGEQHSAHSLALPGSCVVQGEGAGRQRREATRSLPRNVHARCGSASRRSPTQSPSSSHSAVMRPSRPLCCFRRRSSASTKGSATLCGAVSVRVGGRSAGAARQLEHLVPTRSSHT